MPGAGDQRGALSFFTCGGVGAGKSTLIGRMLYDAELVPDDPLLNLAAISVSPATVKGAVDFALMPERLQSEHGPGTTIDVAYWSFSTPKRKFFVADLPGGEPCTPSIATAVTTALAAVLVVDASEGVLTQTRRHSLIAGLMGVDAVILAVNKMDLVDFDQRVFDRIVSDYRGFAAQATVTDITEIPVAALSGENVIRLSTSMPWYEGPVFLDALENVDAGGAGVEKPFRFPVQLANQESPGFKGTIAAGTVRVGDKVKTFPSGRDSRISQIVSTDGEVMEAHADDAVTLVLEDELDICRGDVIASADASPDVADQFAANLIWMSERPLIPERRYTLKLGTAEAGAAVTELKYKVNVNNLDHIAAKTLGMNEVAFCNFTLDRALAIEPYKNGRALGGFILIDRVSDNIVGAGTISFSLRRATNVQWQEVEIGKPELANLKSQKPAIVWLTGFSGAGKSTIANLVQKRLHGRGRHTYLLDGDNVRHGLNRDLGFVEADRVENVRRVAEVAKLFVDSGTLVLVSLISPYRQERAMARKLVEPDEFIEVFVDTPLAVCEQRDSKGLYRKARAGELVNFTGIDAPYEPPENAEIHVDGGTESPDSAADEILRYLQDHGYLSTD